MKNIFARLIPFLMLGIAIVAIVFGLMLLAYLFVFGAIVGFILFLVALIKEKFFPVKHMTKHEKHSGRIIDQDDKK